MADNVFQDNQGSDNIGTSVTLGNNNTFPQQDDPWAFRSLSDSQKTVLAVLPIPSAILSIIGSSLIIYMAYLSKKSKPWTPYNRLLVAMSVYDIITSMTLGAAPFLNPKETSNKALALGNDSTCSAIGFLIQISYSGTLYNAALSYYFLLTAHFGIQNNVVARCIEPFMHIFSVGWPTITAFVGLFLGVYAEPEVGLGCWVNRYPKKCGYGPDGTGEPCLSSMVSWVFGGWIGIGTLISLIVNNFVIWIFVRRRIKRATHARVEDEDDDEYESSRSLTQLSFASSFRTANVRSNNLRSATGSLMNDDTRKSQEKRLRLVSSQAFLFVASYVVSSWATYILRLFESMATDYVWEMELPYNNYALLVLQSIFLPLQGLFNMMVYLRPKYLKTRSDFARESRTWAIRRAIWGCKVEPVHSIHVEGVNEDAEGVNKDAYQQALSNDMISSLTTGSGGGGGGGGREEGVGIENDANESDRSRLYQQRLLSGQAPAIPKRTNSLDIISENAESTNNSNRKSDTSERRLSAQSDRSNSAAIMMDGSIREA